MVTAGSGRSAKARAREFKASGNKAMAHGSFSKAVRQYGRALELDPGNAVLYSNRSATHFNLRQFAESLEDAESALLCDESWWKAYKRKGLALIHLQRYGDAIAALEKGIELLGAAVSNREMEKNLEFARACQEQAQNLYILPEPHMMERLESVPVFIVTDDIGQPFFVTYEDGQQVCTFYFDKVDADATLQWIQEENPSIGTSARVIHITLNQAFTLAQETQKQYYEETTRAAVEEDRLAALEALPANPGASADEKGADQIDVDGDAGDETVETGEADDVDAQGTVGPVEADENDAGDILAGADPAEKKCLNGGEENAEKGDAGQDGSVIDENAPLSFQFRPELRQVKVAVELLNLNPNPPVRPILRDPPSVKEAKAKARAEEEASLKKVDGPEGVTIAEAGVSEEGGKTSEAVVQTAEEAESGEEQAMNSDAADDELTVENFNGIPVFQASGLTFLRNNQQLVPLFCSRWDLEAAWDQLVATPGSGVNGKCEVEVGTLEDVLRRMSESKTKEFENVIFIPSRESMSAIGQRFPLHDFTTRSRLVQKPVVKKVSFSKAKEIKARGGTQAEIRAAIEEDLQRYRDRQRMADLVASLNQVDQPTAAEDKAGETHRYVPRRRLAAEKPISGHERREVLRKKRDARNVRNGEVAAMHARGTTASTTTNEPEGPKMGTDA